MEKDFKDFLGGLKVSEETAALVRAYDLAVASFKFFNGVGLVAGGVIMKNLKGREKRWKQKPRNTKRVC